VILVDAQHKQTQYEGRININNAGVAEIYWPGSSFKIKFKGTKLKAILRDEWGQNYYNAIIDDHSIHVLKLDLTKKKQDIPPDAPPLFICAATDDQLGLALPSSNLYNVSVTAKKEAELHMYLKGGHGFGMRKQGLPTDNG